MYQQVQVKSMTSTNQAVMITIGSIGSFFVGLSMIFLMNSLIKIESSKLITKPAANEAMKLTDIESIDVGSDPTQTGDAISLIEFGTFDSSGSPTQLFGTYDPNDLDHEYYTDGIETSTSISLQVKVSPSTTQPFLLSVIGANTPNTSALIPAANAQIHVPSINTVCMNDSSESVAYAPDETGLFGIPTAHAQIQVNTNTSPDPTDYSIYYVDKYGNIYSDINLVHRVNPVLCQSITEKIYSPLDLNGVTSNKNFGETSATFATSWNHILGSYNMYHDEQFVDYAVDYSIINGLPFFTLTNASGASEFPVNLPEATITLDDGVVFPVQTICMPQQSFNEGEWNVYFYDTDGNPYADVFLQNQVSCGKPVNSCSTINCTKFPEHPCCAVESEAVL